MNSIYYNFLRFLANQQAKQQIAKVLKDNRSDHVKFRYNNGFLSTKVSLKEIHGPEMQWIEQQMEKVSEDIHRILAERQSTFDRLCRERYGQEEWQ